VDATGTRAVPDVRWGGLRLFGATLVYGVVLFGAAGTVRWSGGWAYLAVMAGVLVVYGHVAGRHPGLVAERTRPPKDAEKWDRPLVALIGVVGPFAFVVLSGLDRRYRWSPSVPGWWTLAGLVAVAAGGALTNWAVAANGFFSALVRIQRDRDHVVVDGGPYRFVRHPGYLGSLLAMPGAAAALGSRWALVPVAVTAVLIVIRTALEDRTLHRELQGYAVYAQQTRFRLVPGLW
jgi:protein-S-isoprenylcysteine O-methyltransferase Ste14